MDVEIKYHPAHPEKYTPIHPEREAVEGSVTALRQAQGERCVDVEIKYHPAHAENTLPLILSAKQSKDL